MYTDDELLMISALQHIAFCERQWALIHLEQQWLENFDTARGEVFHERAHLAGYSIKGSVRSERAMRLKSYQLGLSGMADIVEFVEDAQGSWKDETGRCYAIRPVEYKVGKPKIEDWDRLQVCAQALCLEEMYDCTLMEGALFYGKTRHREAIQLTESLKEQVTMLANRMHELYAAQQTPDPPRKMVSRCRRCSLLNICLPSAYTKSAGRYWEQGGFCEQGKGTV